MAVVGAGPAGLVLAALLHRAGIDTVVLESRSRGYIEQRVRAGVLEAGTVAVVTDLGAGDRLALEAMRHDGFELRFDGAGHYVPVREITGHPMTFYGQQELVKDLVALRLRTGAPLLFEAPVESIDGVADEPVVRYRQDGAARELHCEVVVGCDGFHGAGRPAVPAGAVTAYEHRFPMAWLGVLAEVGPSSEVSVYATHDDGLAMHSMRTPRLSRFYVQCRPQDRIEDWPDERIWAALHRRLATDDGWTLREGPIVERSISPLRSYVAEPMQFGNLFLAGDAAHIVPPTGAKGLNLAVRDAVVLADRLITALTGGRRDAAEDYTEVCLRHVWSAQQFASWFTRLLHAPPDETPFDRRLRRAELRGLVSSEAALRSLAERHAGHLPTGRPAARRAASLSRAMAG